MTSVLIEKLCRCCLNGCEQSTELFDRVLSFDANVILDDNFTYADAILMCTSIRCDENAANLPKLICDICLQQLITALLFRTKCLASDSLLKDQLNELKRSIDKANIEQESNAGGTLPDHCRALNVNDKNCDVLEKCLWSGVDKESNNEKNTIRTLETQPNGPSDVRIDYDDARSHWSGGICEKVIETDEETSAVEPAAIINVISNSVTHNKQTDRISYKKFKCVQCEKEFHSETVFDAHREYHKKSLASNKFVEFPLKIITRH